MAPKLTAASPPAAPPSPTVTFDTEYEFWIVPSRLKPTSPPTNEPASPVTAPLACELTIEPPESFRPTRPPTRKALGWLMAIDDCELVIAPGLSPTRPPTMLSDPPLTCPLALEFAIEPGPEEMDTPLKPQPEQP